KFVFVHHLYSPTNPAYSHHILYRVCFFFNDPAPTEIYTLSLHDALPISVGAGPLGEIVLQPRIIVALEVRVVDVRDVTEDVNERDRKSTRLNSSHVAISYAVFCLKKKN